MRTPYSRLCLAAGAGDETMTAKDSEPNDAAARRKARLAEALRANLQRRKAQLRSRRTGQADARPDGLGVSGQDKKD
jgi:hypothetical protein